MLRVARLIVEVPEEDSLVIGEGGKYVLHIFLELRIESEGVCAERSRRVPYPAGVVDARLRLRLCAIL